jgi:hypothetical protein
MLQLLDHHNSSMTPLEKLMKQIAPTAEAASVAPTAFGGTPSFPDTGGFPLQFSDPSFPEEGGFGPSSAPGFPDPNAGFGNGFFSGFG